jgi:hypothetical protein
METRPVDAEKLHADRHDETCHRASRIVATHPDNSGTGIFKLIFQQLYYTSI